MEASLQGVYVESLWTWASIGNFTPAVALHLDGLSLTLLGVISGVGFLIHLFASWYMRGDEGYSRFFAYMNLFVASMLLLVLADDLVILFFGWEGVGLCSYLLIGFYYRDPDNGAAAIGQRGLVVMLLREFRIPLGYEVPVHDVPPRGDIVGALVLVFEVVGVLPDIEAEQRRAFTTGDSLAHDGVVLIGGGDDLQLALVERQPRPTAAEPARGGFAKILFETGDIAEDLHALLLAAVIQQQLPADHAGNAE